MAGETFVGPLDVNYLICSKLRMQNSARALSAGLEFRREGGCGGAFDMLGEELAVDRHYNNSSSPSSSSTATLAEAEAVANSDSEATVGGSSFGWRRQMSLVERRLRHGQSLGFAGWRSVEAAHCCASPASASDDEDAGLGRELSVSPSSESGSPSSSAAASPSNRTSATETQSSACCSPSRRNRCRAFARQPKHQAASPATGNNGTDYNYDTRKLFPNNRQQVAQSARTKQQKFSKDSIEEENNNNNESSSSSSGKSNKCNSIVEEASERELSRVANFALAQAPSASARAAFNYQHQCDDCQQSRNNQASNAHNSLSSSEACRRRRRSRLINYSCNQNRSNKLERRRELSEKLRQRRRTKLRVTGASGERENFSPTRSAIDELILIKLSSDRNSTSDLKTRKSNKQYATKSNSKVSPRVAQDVEEEEVRFCWSAAQSLLSLAPSSGSLSPSASSARPSPSPELIDRREAGQRCSRQPGQPIPELVVSFEESNSSELRASCENLDQKFRFGKSEKFSSDDRLQIRGEKSRSFNDSMINKRSEEVYIENFKFNIEQAKEVMDILRRQQATLNTIESNNNNYIEHQKLALPSTPITYPNNTLIVDLGKCHRNLTNLWPFQATASLAEALSNFRSRFRRRRRSLQGDKQAEATRVDDNSYCKQYNSIKRDDAIPFEFQNSVPLEVEQGTRISISGNNLLEAAANSGVSRKQVNRKFQNSKLAFRMPDSLMRANIELKLEDYNQALNVLTSDIRFKLHLLLYHRVQLIWLLLSTFLCLLMPTLFIINLEPALMFAATFAAWLCLQLPGHLLTSQLRSKLNSMLEKSVAQANSFFMDHNLMLGVINDGGLLVKTRLLIPMLYFDTSQCREQIESIISIDSQKDTSSSTNSSNENENRNFILDYSKIDFPSTEPNKMALAQSQLAKKIILRYSQRWISYYDKRKLMFLDDKVKARHLSTGKCLCQFIEEQFKTNDNLERLQASAVMKMPGYGSGSGSSRSKCSFALKQDGLAASGEKCLEEVVIAKPKVIELKATNQLSCTESDNHQVYRSKTIPTLSEAVSLKEASKLVLFGQREGRKSDLGLAKPGPLVQNGFAANLQANRLPNGNRQQRVPSNLSPTNSSNSSSSTSQRAEGEALSQSDALTARNGDEYNIGIGDDLIKKLRLLLEMRKDNLQGIEGQLFSSVNLCKSQQPFDCLIQASEHSAYATDRSQDETDLNNNNNHGSDGNHISGASGNGARDIQSTSSDSSTSSSLQRQEMNNNGADTRKRFYKPEGLFFLTKRNHNNTNSQQKHNSQPASKQHALEIC